MQPRHKHELQCNSGLRATVIYGDKIWVRGHWKCKTSDLILLSKYRRRPDAWNKHAVPHLESEAASFSADTAHLFRLIPWLLELDSKLNIQKMKIMASGLITSWEIDGQTVETVSDFVFLGSKITTDGDYSHEIKRCLLLGRKVMTNLYSILKSRKTPIQYTNAYVWNLERW